MTETEVALFDAMQQLQGTKDKFSILATPSNVSGIIVSRATKATKTSKMAEWKRFPLQTHQDVEMWWHGVNSNWEVESGRSPILCHNPLLKISDSNQRLFYENASNGFEMHLAEDHHHEMTQDHSNRLGSYGGVQELGYASAQVLHGGNTIFSEYGHAFSLGLESRVPKEYPGLDPEKATDHSHGEQQKVNEYSSMSGTPSGAPSTHEKTSPMSMASPSGQGSETIRLQEKAMGSKAHSLSKKLDHIYY